MRSPVRVEESARLAARASKQGCPSCLRKILLLPEPHQPVIVSSARYPTIFFPFLTPFPRQYLLHCVDIQALSLFLINSWTSSASSPKSCYSNKIFVQSLRHVFKLQCYERRAKTFMPFKVWNAAIPSLEHTVSGGYQFELCPHVFLFAPPRQKPAILWN